MSNRTTGQTLLLALGTLILVGGLACVVLGFVSFGSSDPGFGDTDPGSDDNSFLLFAGGGFAAVVGFGIIAFTRASILTGNGGYRITIEQGVASTGGRFCSSCGRPTSPTAKFCDGCGAAVG